MCQQEDFHECDLFLMSSHHSYMGEKILPIFAQKGRANVHGWGIGSYSNGSAHVIRSADPVVKNVGGSANLNREFSLAVQATSSPLILGHLRLTSRGTNKPTNNHPFKLNFLGYDWLLIHNGTATKNLMPDEERILTESDSDTPRVFEFLRKYIINYCRSNYKKSLIEACRHAFKALVAYNPNGKFNLILSNGYLSFAFIHWRPFYLLNREKSSGDVAILSTIENLTRDEEWIKFEQLPNKKAKMLVFSGYTLLFNGDI